MSRDTTVIAFRQPDIIDDPLTELAREGARRILAQVLIAEADAFVAMWKDERLPDGRDRIVRHGHGPHRAIQTGVGPVEVRRAKVRDRGDVGTEEKIRFSSAILPKWARRTKSLDALLPVLYLRGVSTGDFQEALAALLGKEAPNLSPAVISRLTAQWQVDYDAWQKRDLSARRYVYVWADGVYLQARMEDNAECMLVLIGATPEGKKELVGFQTGVRESAQSWRELLIDVKQRGLEIGPDLAVGDGALGFWKAIEEAFPSTRHQRCWVHKTANVLNKVALSVQVNMKADLREIYGAPTRAAAEVAIDVVGHQTSIASESGQCPFDHPSPTHDLEAALGVRALDDFQLDRLTLERGFELRSSIAAVGEDFSDPWKQTARLADQIGSAVAVLDVGRNHRDAEILRLDPWHNVWRGARMGTRPADPDWWTPAGPQNRIVKPDEQSQKPEERLILLNISGESAGP